MHVGSNNDDKPLSEQMMAWFTDAYMRHLASSRKHIMAMMGRYCCIEHVFNDPNHCVPPGSLKSVRTSEHRQELLNFYGPFLGLCFFKMAVGVQIW